MNIDIEKFILEWGDYEDALKLVDNSNRHISRETTKEFQKKFGIKKIQRFGRYEPNQIRELLLKNETKYEGMFRRALEKKGIDFEQQKIIFTPNGKFYICDFYIYDLNMIIEIDGEHHKHMPQLRKDEERDRILRKKGYIVKRISNMAVNNKC